MEQGNFIVAGSTATAIDKNLLRQVRGSFVSKVDLRFFLVVIFSVLLHTTIIVIFNKLKLPAPETVVIEQVPERFAKLIIERPIPKKAVAEKKQGTGASEIIANEEKTTKADEPVSSGEKTAADRQKAQQAVAARAQKVEEKVRNVGILGIISGVGTTARGPSVVDVLGSTGAKERFGDIDAALENMSGLTRATNIEITKEKLVKSKEVQLPHKEAIDDLTAGFGVAKTNELAKQGDFKIQKPESIEGAASSNAKRDPDAINAIVARNKVSVRMTYEKYLKRDPALQGKVTIRFTIAASGDVISLKVLENSTGNTELEQDIMRKIKLWKFEAINEGDVTVTYPFVFVPAS